MFKNSILAVAVTLLYGTIAWADNAEVPVLVQASSNAKAMMVIDDSGSMNAIVEHANFSMSDAAVTNVANDIPSIIFRLQSGASAPATSQTLTPVLIELNVNYDNSSTGNLYGTSTLSAAPTSLSSVVYASCNNTSGSNVNCPSPGPSTPQTGPNAFHLFGNTSIVGSSIFATANLAKVSGVNVVDTSGNEYLYAKHRKNDYESLADDWTAVWAKFDGSGNQIPYYTRAFATVGGTVVFNNKQVFLSAGWYRIEYLRWIFYVASAAERAALPGAHRLQIVKSVTQNLIVNNPTVKFGLATLNGSTYSAGAHSGNLYTQWYTPDGNGTTGARPRIRNAIGTAQATLLTSLNSMTPKGGTPLTTAYIEALRYFHGESDNDPYCSSCTYTSPITSSCDAHFVILLTDGLPSGETSNSVFGSYILDYDGDSAESTASNNNCQSVGALHCASFADDAAYFAYNTADFSSTLAGRQSVKTYTVGLGIDYSLLDDIAVDGGTGHSYIANTSEEITQALKSIVSLIVTSAVSGAGAALAETFGDEGRVYRPRFQADRWTGNIDVSTYNPATSALEFQFDMADILQARDLSSNPRRIIAGYDVDHDGRTNVTRSFTTAQAADLRPELFQLFIAGTEDPTLLEVPLTDYTQDSTAQTLIQYIQGYPIADLRNRDRNEDGGTADLGDIVYSRPVEVGPKNGNYSYFTGYNTYTAGRGSQPRILLVGANDGMLHAFSSETGEELWAYIPSSQLKYLERLTRYPYNAEYRRSYVDGQISVEDVYVSGAWRTYAMFGLRKGGSTYTVLDITDRSNPTLVWEVSDAANAGESWSKPVVIVSNGSGANPASYNWYMGVGTGEGKATAGTNILIYSLSSATPPTPTVISVSAADPIGARTSNIATVQGDSDFNVDRLYVGSEEGDMYRVHVTGASPASWVVQKLFDGSNTQPIVSAPVPVLVDNPQFVSSGSGVGSMPYSVGLYWGTGRYDLQSDISAVGGVSQRIFGIFDPINTTTDAYANVLTNQTTANLQDQSVSTFAVRRDADKIYRIPSGKSGFYMNLSTTISLSAGNTYLNPTGMVFYEPVNFRGALIFSTFMPNTGLCSVGGYGFIQGVNFRTGGGFISDYSDIANPFYNGGIPDMDNNGTFNAADVTSAVNSTTILPALDTKIESIVSGAAKPYVHSGTLTKDDIRLHASNGGILPAVSSLGNQGAPVSPSILKGAHKIVVQPAYPVPPEVGSSGSGSSGGAGTEVPSSDIPGPELLPLEIYNLPPKLLSFHESTGE